MSLKCEAVLEKRVDVFFGHNSSLDEHAVHHAVHQVSTPDVAHANLEVEVALLQAQAGVAGEHQSVAAVFRSGDLGA